MNTQLSLLRYTVKSLFCYALHVLLWGSESPVSVNVFFLISVRKPRPEKAQNVLLLTLDVILCGRLIWLIHPNVDRMFQVQHSLDNIWLPTENNSTCPVPQFVKTKMMPIHLYYITDHCFESSAVTSLQIMSNLSKIMWWLYKHRKRGMVRAKIHNAL